MSIRHFRTFRGLRKNTPPGFQAHTGAWEGRRIRSYHFSEASDLITRLQSDPNLRLLCGFEKAPDKARFSRAFARIAEMKIMDKVQDATVRLAFREGAFVQHVRRDSAAIPAREKAPCKKAEKEEKRAKKRGRPPKNAPKEPKQPTVLEKQVTQGADKSIAALDVKCSWGGGG